MRRLVPENSHVLCDGTRSARMKTFEKGLSNKGYAKHTPTLRKPKFRLTDAHGFRIREALSKKL
ncbi:MAG: hypothetical protein Q7U60_08305 [Candidatus Methanoperedens sp.]|nr:hypothetical protein [Candidatus Methanoperedens sp.]